MLALTPHLRIFVAFDPIDFRCGMNRLAQIAKDLFSEDPQSGVLFVFRNRRQSEVKMLVYDGSGYYLIHRRLSSGRLAFWPKTLLQQKEPGITVESSELLVLLRGGDPRGTIPESWLQTVGLRFTPPRPVSSIARILIGARPTIYQIVSNFLVLNLNKEGP